MNTRQVTKYINDKTGRNFTTGNILTMVMNGELNPYRPGRPKPNVYNLKDVDERIRILSALTIKDVMGLMRKELKRPITWFHINDACNNDMDNLFHISLPRSRIFPQDTLWILRDTLREQLGMEVE